LKVAFLVATDKTHANAASRFIVVCILILFSVNYDQMLFYHEAKH